MVDFHDRRLEPPGDPEQNSARNTTPPAHDRSTGGNYLDFEIEIGTGSAQQYPITVLRSPAGEAHEVMHFPFDAYALESSLQSLEIALLRSGSGFRTVLTDEEQVVQDFGRKLFNALISGEARSRYDMSSDNARQRGLGMRIKLRIHAPELARLPWEFLYDPRQAEYVCLSRDTPIVRYIELPRPIQPLVVRPPLQILGMVPSPTNLPSLDIAREKQRVERAVAVLQNAGLLKLTWMEGQTWRDLQRAMRSGPWHIFHFIGHGGFDVSADEGVIVLEDETGAADNLSATKIGRLLADHRSLRLVILNMCEGARGSKTGIFSSAASILVRRGMPAVLAMQYEITDQAAIEFSRAFYEALADGLPVDAAVCEARKAVSLAEVNTFEWGTPVLYMRAPDGRVFDLGASQRPSRAAEVWPDTQVQDAELDRVLEELYTEGLAAFYVEDWDKATRSFQAILKERPNHTAAAAKLEEARRQQQYASLYARAQERQRAGDWQPVIQALEELTQAAPEYKDASALLKNARKQKLLHNLYSEAAQLHTAGQWQAVVNVFARIHAIDPAFPDADQLQVTAEKEVAEQQRKEELRQRYNQAVRSIDAGRWQEANDLLAQIQSEAPDFQQTRRLLARVEAQLAQARDQKQRQKQTAVLFEQAHNLLRGHKWQQALEKMEEIGKLDDAFEDPDHIAEKARAALDAEEQEARQQTELAGLYADAVRLLGEGNYQGALQQWNAVQARDPKYPDRQKVRATASRKLKALTPRAAPRRWHIPFPRRAWIFVLAFPVLFGLLALGYFAWYEPFLAPVRSVKCSGIFNDVVRSGDRPNDIKNVKSFWRTQPVILDGKITFGSEWADAYCSNLFMQESYSGGYSETKKFTAQWWVKNDQDWLYILVRVPRQDFEAHSVFVGYYYPYPYTGRWQSSDAWGYELREKYPYDVYGWDETRFYPDTEANPPGRMDTQGASSQDDQYTWFEVRKRLHSGDGRDWNLQPGYTYGTDQTGDMLFGASGLLPEDASHLDEFFAQMVLLSLGSPGERNNR